MNNWMLMTVSLLYLGTGIQKAMAGGWWWLGFWSCYALANVCWIMAAK